MKTIAILLFFLIPIQWEPSFEHAKVLAKEKNALILLNFSGSDWCVPCIGLRKEFLETEAFSEFATKNLILVNADFPRKKKNSGSDEQIKRNEALAEQYNPNGAFPLTLLMTADGKVVKSWSGKPKVSVEKWVEEIQGICEANK
ncbi:thioredoxin family protein [Flavobacterium sp. SM2513]|uniref:thioredoxin family protein n=1 Tax=Flavobacterium sp. SM2513 TaxID=3424766 RepID=UPI003D7FC814